MLISQSSFLRHLPKLSLLRSCYKNKRNISALHIPSDKATENYVTLRPYMDFEDILTNNTASLEASIKHRGLPINMTAVWAKYSKYREGKKQIESVEEEREQVSNRLKELSKSSKGSIADIEALKAKGKELRNNLKTLKSNFHPLEDDFVIDFLNLPNLLHPHCPVEQKEKVLYRSRAQRVEQGCSHLKSTDLIRFIDNSRYYLMKEAAEFDVQSTQALARYFAYKGGFIPSANPDFVRCVLLEANATPLANYHMVVERDLQNKLNPAYLTGGGAFESFLAGVTKMVVYPSVMPLRFVSTGRSYLRKSSPADGSENLFTATQSNTVQTFVAAENSHDADDHMHNILNLAVDFYQELGLHFRIVYADASVLSLSECLRAEIQVYSPAQQRYVCVGQVSNYSDYVSKRILFTMRKERDYHFLHLVGGPVMFTTTLIAALIENGVSLSKCKLLGAFRENETDDGVKNFRGLFS